MKTYSFMNVQASLIGPGCALNLGFGSGIAEEGITVERAGELSGMTIGADGLGFHSMHADKSGHITVRVLKTSPLNGALSAVVAFQRLSAANWGQNNLTVTNNSINDTISGQQVAFNKLPMIEYAKDGKFNEWRFDVIDLDYGLGQ